MPYSIQIIFPLIMFPFLTAMLYALVEVNFAQVTLVEVSTDL